jgi:hypothetical protein
LWLCGKKLAPLIGADHVIRRAEERVEGATRRSV